MAISLNKKVSALKVVPEFGIQLGTEILEVNAVFTVKSVTIADNIVTAQVSTVLDNIEAPLLQTYSFNYNPDSGDIFSQVESYLLSLDSFSGAKLV